MAKRLPRVVRENAIALFNSGMSPREISEASGINQETISSWVYRYRKPRVYKGERPEAGRRGHKVGTIRTVLGKLDSGMSIRGIARDTGHQPVTIRTWRDFPKYREATMEYDGEFTYDANDLLDRATVAQYLCGQVRCDGRYIDGKAERLELLFAAIDYQETT